MKMSKHRSHIMIPCANGGWKVKEKKKTSRTFSSNRETKAKAAKRAKDPTKDHDLCWLAIRKHDGLPMGVQ